MAGPLARGNTHLFLIDATIGGTPRQITSGKFNHNGFDWAADGRSILVAAIRKPDAEYLRGDSEIYSVDLDSLSIKSLTDRKGPDGNPVVSPTVSTSPMSATMRRCTRTLLRRFI
jgi:Tol biopolymer transport system component